jgi:hypothetical protein
MYVVDVCIAIIVTMSIQNKRCIVVYVCMYECVIAIILYGLGQRRLQFTYNNNCSSLLARSSVGLLAACSLLVTFRREPLTWGDYVQTAFTMQYIVTITRPKSYVYIA